MDGEQHAADRQGLGVVELKQGMISRPTIHQLLDTTKPRDFRLFSGIWAPEPHDEDCCCLACHPDWVRVPDEAWARHLAGEPARRIAALARQREQAMQDWSV